METIIDHPMRKDMLNNKISRQQATLEAKIREAANLLDTTLDAFEVLARKSGNQGVSEIKFSLEQLKSQLNAIDPSNPPSLKHLELLKEQAAMLQVSTFRIQNKILADMEGSHTAATDGDFHA